MDKNNDIQVNRVSKREAAPKDMGALFTYIDMVIGMACCLPHEIHDNLYDLMDKTLDEYNELEAKYQESCGMISQYEEENRILQEQTKFVKDSDKFRRERDIYAYHLEGLCRTLNDNDIIANWSEAAIKWNLYKWDEVKGQWCSYDKATTLESCKKHYEEELRIREKEKDEKDKLIDELNSKFKYLKLSTNMMYGCYGYGLNTPDELNRKIEELKKENEELKSKNSKNNDIPYGYFNLIGSLRARIKTLEKENKELKDTLVKDREFGKNVGERIVESIREGCDKGVYKLHPYMKVEIHVEETNNMPTTFDRHAIPRISVIFNNSQTEMERDTAQHECEELNRKIKKLKKENKDLKSTIVICERNAKTARNLCDNVAVHAERARNKTPWFNDDYEEEK